MKYATSTLTVYLLFASTCAYSDTLTEILRTSVLQNGLTTVESVQPTTNEILAQIGRVFFESTAVSANGEMSCRLCHLDEFGSSDGLPNAIGVGGVGKGRERLLSPGATVPRNTLPLWGRGGPGFNTFFWDGKVDFSNGKNISQFGNQAPSTDPLIVTVHLPPVEIREMLQEDTLVRSNKQESVDGARGIYEFIIGQLRSEESTAMMSLANYYEVQLNEIEFLHVAKAISEFIRFEFMIKESRFHKFVSGENVLSEIEQTGALLFYGKGKCANCHSGPYFTDFNFHAIPIPQLGIGKNGFGIDYGRFNVTHLPEDLYKFRTPPLWNVSKTGPYGHSGSISDLRTAIQFHFDPLGLVDVSAWSGRTRTEYYKRLAISAQDQLSVANLDNRELDAVVAFLKTLSF